MWEERHEVDPRVSPAQQVRGPPAPYTVQAFVENGSPSLIYDVTFNWHRATASAGQNPTIGALPPGQKRDAYAKLPGDFSATANKEMFGAVVYFRDSSRVGWRLRPDGQLDEMTDQQMPVPKGDRL